MVTVETTIGSGAQEANKNTSKMKYRFIILFNRQARQERKENRFGFLRDL
jgi:hypothetical protein